MKTTKKIIGVLSIALIFSCGSSENPKNPDNSNENMKANANIVSIDTIRAVGNTMSEMSFNIKEINVKEGSLVKITLVNDGMDKSMIHNIVFIEQESADKVAFECQMAGEENDFVVKNKVLAYSPLAYPGETVSFEFRAPKKGNYRYFCTYPGHSDKMQGWLYVE